MTRTARPRLPGFCIALAPLLGACQLGLDYSGDTHGLRRQSYPIPGHDHGRELSYLAAGDPAAPRVIFVHGSPGLAEGYANYLQDPIEGLECLAVDRLGYGHSVPNDRAVTSFAEQAESVLPLLVERDGQWPILVGHSLGGPIVARIASDHPDKVGAVILVAGGLDPDLEDVRWYNKMAGTLVVKPLLATNINVSNDEMYACKGEVEELAPRLDRIRCPILITHGTTDDLVSYENVEFSLQSFRNNPNVWVFTLLGEGHRVTKLRQDEIRECVGAMRNFLRGDIVLHHVDETTR